jgi:hypothetical protein
MALQKKKIDSKARNVNCEYITASRENHIFIVEIDKRNALINPSLVPKSNLPSLKRTKIDSVPKIAEGNRAANSLLPK